MAIGYLAIVLHAHLPFVRHPEQDFVLEEDWLYEAITETYIPLLQVYEGLKRDGIEFKLTMSLTPTLISMLKDPLLQDRYDAYLLKLQELVGREYERYESDGHRRYLADHYIKSFIDIRATWEQYDRDLVVAFKQFQDTGNLEIVTCGATHGYLPLMQMYPEAVWAQLSVACEHYQETFGIWPRGIWLPECAYYPGLDRLIADAGLRYLITDGHGVLYAKPRPQFGLYAPIFTESGIAVFGRDQESSQQVWSAEIGYPGDPVYREFYKDLGFEADYDYIKPYIMPTGQRKSTGIKYHRITGRDCDLSEKALYDPYWAEKKAIEHAGNFVLNRQRQIDYQYGLMQRPPLVTAPYDAELFGHWWYEGPTFLDALIRHSVQEQQTYQLTHLADYLRAHPTQQVAKPAQSSWGAQGFHEYWLNETNAWIYPHLHKAAERMITLSQQDPQSLLETRALNQAARELLLAQSSDWAFIMRTGTMVPYAERRTRSHLLRFHHLFEMVTQNHIEPEWLAKVEYVDNIFPSLDYQVYRGAQGSPSQPTDAVDPKPNPDPELDLDPEGDPTTKLEDKSA